jgi:hypothetical protein
MHILQLVMYVIELRCHLLHAFVIAVQVFQCRPDLPRRERREHRQYQCRNAEQARR